MKRWYLLIFTILFSLAWLLYSLLNLYTLIPDDSILGYFWIPTLIIFSSIPFIGIYQIINKKKGYRRTAWASITIWLLVMFFLAFKNG